MVDRQEHVAPRPLGDRLDDVQDAAERILDKRLAARFTAQQTLEAQLQACQATVVRARVAEHVRTNAALRIDAPLFRQETDAGQVASLERLCYLRICLPLDVDEALRLVEQLRVEHIGIDAQRLCGCQRNDAWARDVPRVGVHRDGFLPDRELHTHAVDDCSPPGGDRHGFVLLARGALAEIGGSYRLQPCRTGEREPEDE